MTIKPLEIERETEEQTPEPAPRGDRVGQLTEAEVFTYVKPIFDAVHAPLPNPANATFIGKVVAGRVVAFICLQTKLHAEPLYIEPGYSSSLGVLVDAAEKFILSRVPSQWVYAFMPEGKVTQIATALGMTKEPWNILSKLVQQPIEQEPPMLGDLSPITDTEQ